MCIRDRKYAEQALNGIEAEMAALRGCETRLEQTRQRQIEAGQAVQQAQAAFYEASAQLSSTEQQLKHAEESLARSQQQHAALVAQQTGVAAQIRDKQAELNQQQILKAKAEQHCELMRSECEAAQSGLPQRDAELRQAQQALGNSQAVLARLEQAIQVAQTSLRHHKQQIEQLAARHRRLREAMAGIVLPDESRLQQAQQAQATTDKQLAGVQPVSYTLLDVYKRQVMQTYRFEGALDRQTQHKGYGRIWRIPLTFVIDRKGVLRKDGWFGPAGLDQPLLEKVVTPLLEEN